MKIITFKGASRHGVPGTDLHVRAEAIAAVYCGDRADNAVILIDGWEWLVQVPVADVLRMMAGEMGEGEVHVGDE